MQIDEIRKLTDEELFLGKMAKPIINLKFRKATMQLTNVVEIKSVRKDIAKIQTIIRQRQILGSK